jgi:hypothetical protein
LNPGKKKKSAGPLDGVVAEISEVKEMAFTQIAKKLQRGKRGMKPRPLKYRNAIPAAEL